MHEIQLILVHSWSFMKYYINELMLFHVWKCILVHVGIAVQVISLLALNWVLMPYRDTKQTEHPCTVTVSETSFYMMANNTLWDLPALLEHVFDQQFHSSLTDKCIFSLSFLPFAKDLNNSTLQFLLSFSCWRNLDWFITCVYTF